MISLDDINRMKQLDTCRVLESIGMLTKQCQQAWTESCAIRLPKEFSKAKNIVVCGMGGSRFTPRAVKELYSDRIIVPYEIIDDYHLPAYVDNNTLVILSSYSGTTEETVSCGREAISRGAMLTGIAKGGQVKELLLKTNNKGYFFNDIFNPSQQPRIGSGYLLFGHIGLLRILGFLKISDTEIAEAVNFADIYHKNLLAEVPLGRNYAKQIAKQLFDTHPIIITSGFLRGFGNGFANQINENAKMISDYRYIPELNHHLMEGLKHPEQFKSRGIFVLILSDLYDAPIIKRYVITQKVIEKQGFKTVSVSLKGPTKTAQVLEAFTLSGYVSYYLSVLYEVDPSKIPWVDYFKNELSK